MKEYLKFLISRQFLKHFALAVIVLIAFFFGGIFLLGPYTHHGIAITVPDFRGKTVDEALRILEESNLTYKIRDTVYFDDKRKLSILEQDPLPESHVKEGRVIYFTINGPTPPNVKFPENIIEASLRNAKTQLESRGLKVNVIPMEGQHVGLVVEAKYLDQPLKPGDLVPKGSTVDLYVVMGVGGRSIPVPNFVGLTMQQVLEIVRRDTLSAPIVSPANLENDPNAIVDHQKPEPDSTGIIKIYLTEPIYIWLKTRDDE
jgi:beta-lactam-binding protein with PASTA domain